MTEHEKPRELLICECIHNTCVVPSGSVLREGDDGRSWERGERTYECPKCRYPTANDRLLGIGLRLFRVVEAEPVEREREEMLDLLKQCVLPGHRILPHNEIKALLRNRKERMSEGKARYA